MVKTDSKISTEKSTFLVQKSLYFCSKYYRGHPLKWDTHLTGTLTVLGGDFLTHLSGTLGQPAAGAKKIQFNVEKTSKNMKSPPQAEIFSNPHKWDTHLTGTLSPKKSPPT